VEIGFIEDGPRKVSDAISALGRHFGPDAYNIMTNNCNHFANALCMQLLGKPIPSYINRLANLGGFFTACLPQSLLSGTPAGACVQRGSKAWEHENDGGALPGSLLGSLYASWGP